MTHVLILPIVGLVAGILGGLLGIGGGIVMIPAMLLLLPDAFGQGSLHVYQLAALAAATVLSLPAARRHAQAGAIVYSMLPAIISFGLVGMAVGIVVAGTFVQEQTDVLRRIFGVFMFLAVVLDALRARQSRSGARLQQQSCPNPRRWGLLGGVVGLPAGVISGLLGVGGGIWAVPVQHMLLGVRLQNAIANSACMIVCVAAAAAITKSLAIARMADLSVASGWWLALWLTPGAALGGWIGGKLTHRLSTGWLRHAFHALLAITGLHLLLD